MSPAAEFDYYSNQVRTAVDEFEAREIDAAELQRRVQEIAQTRADTAGVLYDKDQSEEWKREARLEYELTYEVELWEPHLERLRQHDPQVADDLEKHLENLRAMAAERRQKRGL